MKQKHCRENTWYGNRFKGRPVYMKKDLFIFLRIHQAPQNKQSLNLIFNCEKSGNQVLKNRDTSSFESFHNPVRNESFLCWIANHFILGIQCVSSKNTKMNIFQLYINSDN